MFTNNCERKRCESVNVNESEIVNEKGGRENEKEK
jgi:hypothetical protein